MNKDSLHLIIKILTIYYVVLDYLVLVWKLYFFRAIFIFSREKENRNYLEKLGSQTSL